MESSIYTNTWTHISQSHPPCGRPVLCIATTRLSSGNYEMSYLVAKWNGLYWVDANTNIMVKLDKMTEITMWYMFEKYYPGKEDGAWG